MIKKEHNDFGQLRIVTTADLLNLPELQKRWTGATDKEILTEERTGRLIPHYLEKAIQTENGIEKWLRQGHIPANDWNGETWIERGDPACIDVVFIESNVEEIEKRRPDFLCKIVNLSERDGEGNSPAGNAPALSEEEREQIENFKQWNKTLHENNCKLNAELEHKNTRIAELEAQVAALTNELAKREEAQTAATSAPGTIVNSDRWEKSVSAAFELWHEIICGSKKNWIYDNFCSALKKKYHSYHTKVLHLAWKHLPEAYKQGAGRPKNPENP